VSNVICIDYQDHQIRCIEHNDETWFVVADVCRCVDLAINSRNGKPNVTVATRELSADQKQKYRVDTPENPKNPWIDMMIVSVDGLLKMLSQSDSGRVHQFKEFVQKQQMNPKGSTTYSPSYLKSAQ
jgi:prophage antirepressor-like protein